MKFFTLLYVAEHEKRYLNGRHYSDLNKIRVFLKNALLLNHTLGFNHSELTILTNKKELIDSLLNKEDIEVIEIPFTLDVPIGINFYSAHFKIDAFNYFSTLNEQYIFLLDNDVVCLKSFPQNMINAVNDKTPMHYVLPRYYLDKSLSDMRKVDSNIRYGIWQGGEFIGGPPNFYGSLYNEIIAIKEKYFNVYKELFHQGDEMLVSIALEKMHNKSLITVDAGAMGIIERYWSNSENRNIRKVDTCFLHLPYDKIFLSKIKINQIYDVSCFFSAYKSYSKIIHFKMVVKAFVKMIEGFSRSIHNGTTNKA